MKEYAHKNLKNVLDSLLKDKIKKISGEVEKLGDLFENRYKSLTNRINYQLKKKIESIKD